MIRRLGHDDLESLQQIAKETFLESFGAQNTEENISLYLTESLSLEALKKQMDDPGSDFYFFYHDSTLAGYLKINQGDAQTDSKLENALEIERIYVKSEYQGMGIGRMLLQYGISIAKDREMDWIWLGVWEHNKKAIAFYEHHGFEKFDRHQFRLGHEIQQDHLMKINLIEAI